MNGADGEQTVPLLYVTSFEHDSIEDFLSQTVRARQDQATSVKVLQTDCGIINDDEETIGTPHTTY